MITTGQLQRIACLSWLLSGALGGCAASAIGDPGSAQDDTLANEQAAADASEPTDEGPKDAGSWSKDASVAKDAAAASTKDAGAAASADAGPVADAGATDAGSSSVTDAGAAKDAGSSAVADAGNTPPAPPADAGTATVDAGSSSTPPSSSNGQCTQDSDCHNVCIAIGILPCCTIAHTCGCTWAPGTYCL